MNSVEVSTILSMVCAGQAWGNIPGNRVLIKTGTEGQVGEIRLLSRTWLQRKEKKNTSVPSEPRENGKSHGGNRQPSGDLSLWHDPL